jgi:hypothetical protein
MSTKVGLYELHEEHKEWIQKLNFYKDDINIFEKRLQELVSKNTKEEATKEIEHFQNQFIIQKNNIDTIKHIITVDEDEIQKEVNKNLVAVDHRKVEDHPKERDLVETFEANYKELREEFNKFSAKWM